MLYTLFIRYNPTAQKVCKNPNNDVLSVHLNHKSLLFNFFVLNKMSGSFSASARWNHGSELSVSFCTEYYTNAVIATYFGSFASYLSKQM